MSVNKKNGHKRSSKVQESVKRFKPRLKNSVGLLQVTREVGSHQWKTKHSNIYGFRIKRCLPVNKATNYQIKLVCFKIWLIKQKGLNHSKHVSQLLFINSISKISWKYIRLTYHKQQLKGHLRQDQRRTLCFSRFWQGGHPLEFKEKGHQHDRKIFKMRIK